MIIVIYWPSTEPSIKRCTSVNKRKNSGSRWALNNNITRHTDGLSQLEIGCQHENQLADWGLWALSDPWLSNSKPRWGRSAAMVVRRTLGQNNSLSPSPTHLLHTTNITLLRIKCERYIFIKKCVRSFIEVRHYVWLCSAYICICMWLYNVLMI